MIDAAGVETTDILPSASTIAFLGVRPQDFNNLEKVTHTPDIVVSMMAGITQDAIRNIFPNARIVRIIPNTPCEFGVGITPLHSKNYDLSDEKTAALHMALSLCGPVFPVAEECMIDWATGISAGGPAYVMHIAEAMIKAAVEIGFSRPQARLLVAHTISGSAQMLLHGNASPLNLAWQVMTPNGTTERGVRILEENNVERALISALCAASSRAHELSTMYD